MPLDLRDRLRHWPGTLAWAALLIPSVPIGVYALRYWSALRQEAYASPEAILKRLTETGRP